MRNAALFAATASGVGGTLVALTGGTRRRHRAADPKAQPPALPAARAPSPFSSDEPRPPVADVTSYNNFCEFGVDKSDPATQADSLITQPWTVEVAGEVQQPQRIDIDALIKRFPLEERVYRLRP